jgi:hypothetical protein
MNEYLVGVRINDEDMVLQLLITASNKELAISEARVRCEKNNIPVWGISFCDLT